jgi:hypothetical protein
MWGCCTSRGSAGGGRAGGVGGTDLAQDQTSQAGQGAAVTIQRSSGWRIVRRWVMALPSIPGCRVAWEESFWTAKAA